MYLDVAGADPVLVFVQTCGLYFTLGRRHDFPVTHLVFDRPRGGWRSTFGRIAAGPLNVSTVDPRPYIVGMGIISKPAPLSFVQVIGPFSASEPPLVHEVCPV